MTDWNPPLRQGRRSPSQPDLASRASGQPGPHGCGWQTPLDNASPGGVPGGSQTTEDALAGTCLDILHVNCGKNDKLALKWIADGIPITKKLNARHADAFLRQVRPHNRRRFDYLGDASKNSARKPKGGHRAGPQNTISTQQRAHYGASQATSRSTTTRRQLHPRRRDILEEILARRPSILPFPRTRAHRRGQINFRSDETDHGLGSRASPTWSQGVASHRNDMKNLEYVHRLIS